MKYGIVGRSGAGKSTLLSILTKNVWMGEESQSKILFDHLTLNDFNSQFMR